MAPRQAGPLDRLSDLEQDIGACHVRRREGDGRRARRGDDDALDAGRARRDRGHDHGGGQRVPSAGRVAPGARDGHDELTSRAALDGGGLLGDGGALHLGELAHPRRDALEERLCVCMHEVLRPRTHQVCAQCSTHTCTIHTPRLQLRIGGVVGGLELLLRHRVLALALGQVAQLARVLQEALDAVGLDILHDDQSLLSSRRVDRLEARSRDLLGRDRAQSWACFRLDREHAVDCGSCRSARSGSSEEVAVDGVKETTGRRLPNCSHGRASW